MEPILITILVDTYNYGSYIDEALQSVLYQDFPAENMQVLVVDDGSTDDTEQRVKRYGPRIEYLKKANGGQASAFNYGLAHARGQIVAFLDADDYWLPGKLSRIADEFHKHLKVGMVHHRLKELDMRTGQIVDGFFIVRNGDLSADVESILTYNPTPTSSLAFKRDVLEKIFPVPETIRIQADGYIQAIAPFVTSIAAIDEPLGVYRNHGSNLFFLSDTEGDKQRRQLRALTMKEIVDGMRKWFDLHGFRNDNLVVRAAIGRWQGMLEREKFTISPPSRIRFFLYLLRSYRYRLKTMGWRLAMVNFLDAAGALIVGYEGFPQWEKQREEWTRSVGRVLRLR